MIRVTKTTDKLYPLFEWWPCNRATLELSKQAGFYLDSIMYEKKCFKCGLIKDITEFYKHTRMKDGHVNKCNTCNKKDVSENYRVNIDYYKKYDITRNLRPERIADIAKQNKVYKEKWPNIYKAHIAFGNAIRDGKIERQGSCSECSSRIRIQGHHDDYSFPLDVRWLCCKCHHKWHKTNTPLNRV